MVYVEGSKQSTEFGVQGPKGVTPTDTRKAAEEAVKKSDELVVVKRTVGEWEAA